MTILVSIRSLAPPISIVTPRASIAVARAPSRTVTPSSPSCSATFPESLSLNAATTRSPASSRITRAPRRVDPPEVALHRAGRDRELPRDLDARRPAADDDERQPLGAFVRVIRALGLFEGAVEALRRSMASATVFSPYVTSRHSSLPK